MWVYVTSKLYKDNYYHRIVQSNIALEYVLRVSQKYWRGISTALLNKSKLEVNSIMRPVVPPLIQPYLKNAA